MENKEDYNFIKAKIKRKQTFSKTDVSFFVTFSQLTKINLDAQKVEQMLRDELADSVSKIVSDADRQRILELEKNEMELKVEVSK